MNTASLQERQQTLRELIRHSYPGKQGKIVLFAGFEFEKYRFRQESSFYYLTGLEEPAVVAVFDVMTDDATLYIPRYATSRNDWMYNSLGMETDLGSHGIACVKYLGQDVAGYHLSLAHSLCAYGELQSFLHTVVAQQEMIFTIYPEYCGPYIEQRIILDRLLANMPSVSKSLIDISGLIAHMRRKKSVEEIVFLQKAIDVTLQAQRAAAGKIADGVNESTVQAGLESVMLSAQMRTAFTSIVGSGLYSTVLHYHANNNVMRDGDLVVVDIGAAHHNYCADITRTYPVSGKFTLRQKELYDIVLETQEYIAQVAQPGYWLNNKACPEQSLNHLARAFLRKRGFDNYFLHGIGHYLGLDVHDVGDYAMPLASGDVITIEPGLYLKAERIGIRIEDDYLITDSGAKCLSIALPKEVDQIENLMRNGD